MFEEQIKYIDAAYVIEDFYLYGHWLSEEEFSNEFLWFNIHCFSHYYTTGLFSREIQDFMIELLSAVLMHRGMNG